MQDEVADQSRAAELRRCSLTAPTPVQQVHLVNAALLCRAGEGILENVQLRVEAFEYLQLPFAIKEGSVGRLKLQVRAIVAWCAEAVVMCCQ